jgi:hypothetical protein
MAHEHNGNCCGEHEQHLLDHQQQIVDSMAHLCCSGHCHHPEHWEAQAIFDQQNEAAAPPEGFVNQKVEKKKDKKKKKRFQMFGSLLVKSPSLQIE